VTSLDILELYLYVAYGLTIAGPILVAVGAIVAFVVMVRHAWTAFLRPSAEPTTRDVAPQPLPRAVARRSFR
jgi:hypothetical protein